MLEDSNGLYKVTCWEIPVDF